jgi:phosphate transport system substrate-binding protein
MRAGVVFSVAVAVLGLAGCGGDGSADGTITADGSSTVRPFVAQAAADYEAQTDVRVEVGITGDVVGEAGTGGGFELFCRGETDLANASRPIDEDERALCEEEGTEYVEFRVATDAVTNVVSNQNDWATCLTVAQLRAIWEAGSDVRRWSDVDPTFPPVTLELFGPGRSSGTFEYFSSQVLGPTGASRSDYSGSAEANTIVGRVASEPGSLGYVGHSYYEQNRDRLRALEVDDGNGCVAPDAETAQDGTYPFSRPLFVYVSRSSLDKDEDVREFVGFMLEHQQSIAEAASFVPLSDEQLAEERAKFEAEVR